ncbi:MAG: hypothetical protein KF715_16375 [Candidatus Didemnitutus sp.]|nr:hypothetical protein [Candidatus Didemnitutus sp.]
MPTHRRPPWEKKRSAPPSAAEKVKLSAESIAWARARARAAGRRYPNLVDNMAAARRQREAEHRAEFPHGWRGEAGE